jgi:hypothetical protein
MFLKKIDMYQMFFIYYELLELYCVCKKERIMQVLRNDISNVLSGELWICMKVSKAMFKKENIFKGNYVQERKEFLRKLSSKK